MNSEQQAARDARFAQATAPVVHRTWVDEDTDHDGGTMFAAVCETCSWSSRWVHADEFDFSDDPDVELPHDRAEGAAVTLGREHEATT